LEESQETENIEKQKTLAMTQTANVEQQKFLEETENVEQETTGGTAPEKTADKKQGLEMENSTIQERDLTVLRLSKRQSELNAAAIST